MHIQFRRALLAFCVLSCSGVSVAEDVELTIERLTWAGIKMVASNRKARHDFEVLDTFEAGIMLRGQEVKALIRQLTAPQDQPTLYQDQRSVAEIEGFLGVRPRGCHCPV